ncbi:MAG: AsmA family protein, partial [Candidatus Omnitrophica bacterium]|nr:AsmA family protein [Candidatus Omnitrophota bacterium]
MKTWHKILIILILLFLLAYLLVLYINTSLIPVKLKDILINNISEKLQKETSIDSLKFSIAKGFVLTGLKIYEGPKEDNKLFLKSDEISFALLVLPSLKKLQLIIPRISIDAPSINIIRAHDGVWNFSSIFAAKAEDEKPSRINISIKSLSFDGAEVVFKDYYQDREFHKRIKGLRGSAGLSLPSSFSVNCIGKIDESSIKVIAKYSIPKKDLSAEVETKNLEFSDYWNNYI